MDLPDHMMSWPSVLSGSGKSQWLTCVCPGQWSEKKTRGDRETGRQEVRWWRQDIIKKEKPADRTSKALKMCSINKELFCLKGNKHVLESWIITKTNNQKKPWMMSHNEIIIFFTIWVEEESHSRQEVKQTYLWCERDISCPDLFLSVTSSSQTSVHPNEEFLTPSFRGLPHPKLKYYLTLNIIL